MEPPQMSYPTYIDYEAAEIKARELRAEAIKEMASSLREAFSSILSEFSVPTNLGSRLPA